MIGKPVVILGVFVADAAFRAGRLPRPGETLTGESFVLGPGGKGSNQAVAAARLGAETHFVTRLGADAFADMAEALWAEAGVHPAATRDPESHTGAAFIFVDAGSGENAIIIVPGAAARLGPGDLDAQAALIGRAGGFVAQLEQPLEARREPGLEERDRADDAGGGLGRERAVLLHRAAEHDDHRRRRRIGRPRQTDSLPSPPAAVPPAPAQIAPGRAPWRPCRRMAETSPRPQPFPSGRRRRGGSGPRGARV